MTEYSDRPIKDDKASPVVLAAGYAGLFPFVAAALVSWFGPKLPFGLDAVDLLKTYSAIILSFLGGIRWGVALSPMAGAMRSRHILFSTLPPLTAWIATLLPAGIGLPLLLIGFSAQLYWDIQAHEMGLIPHWFRNLRVTLTTGAVLSLIAILPELA